VQLLHGASGDSHLHLNLMLFAWMVLLQQQLQKVYPAAEVMA
jgi:hypothetical protein